MGNVGDVASPKCVFSVNELVTWSDATPETVGRYGEGPFRVLRVLYSTPDNRGGAYSESAAGMAPEDWSSFWIVFIDINGKEAPFGERLLTRYGRSVDIQDDISPCFEGKEVGYEAAIDRG